METEEKKAKLRKDFPHMFTHDELQPGEVWLGDFLVDAVGVQASLLKGDGYKSVRIGKNAKAGYKPLFVLLEEAVQFLVIN